MTTGNMHRNHTTTTTVLWPFFGTNKVSRCQKKASSGLYGATEDNMSQTH